jgi:hypothetical protein
MTRLIYLNGSINNVKRKTKKIVFRVEVPLYDFIQKFSLSNGLTMSEFIRNVLVYFHYGFLAGEFHKSLPEMRGEFERKFHKKLNTEKRSNRLGGMNEIP